MSTTYRAALGAGEHDFCLTVEAVGQLEAATKCGICMLTDRIIHRRWSQSELIEVLKLALVTAGTPPADAAILVNAHLHPLTNSWAIAVELLTRLWSGEAGSEGSDTGEHENTRPEPPQAESEGI